MKKLAFFLIGLFIYSTTAIASGAQLVVAGQDVGALINKGNPPSLPSPEVAKAIKLQLFKNNPSNQNLLHSLLDSIEKSGSRWTTQNIFRNSGLHDKTKSETVQGQLIVLSTQVRPPLAHEARGFQTASPLTKEQAELKSNLRKLFGGNSWTNLDAFVVGLGYLGDEIAAHCLEWLDSQFDTGLINSISYLGINPNQKDRELFKLLIPLALRGKISTNTVDWLANDFTTFFKVDDLDYFDTFLKRVLSALGKRKDIFISKSSIDKLVKLIIDKEMSSRWNGGARDDFSDAECTFVDRVVKGVRADLDTEGLAIMRKIHAVLAKKFTIKQKLLLQWPEAFVDHAMSNLQTYNKTLADQIKIDVLAAFNGDASKMDKYTEEASINRILTDLKAWRETLSETVEGGETKGSLLAKLVSCQPDQYFDETMIPYALKGKTKESYTTKAEADADFNKLKALAEQLEKLVQTFNGIMKKPLEALNQKEKELTPPLFVLESDEDECVKALWDYQNNGPHKSGEDFTGDWLYYKAFGNSFVKLSPMSRLRVFMYELMDKNLSTMLHRDLIESFLNMFIQVNSTHSMVSGSSAVAIMGAAKGDDPVQALFGIFRTNEHFLDLQASTYPVERSLYQQFIRSSIQRKMAILQDIKSIGMTEDISPTFHSLAFQMQVTNILGPVVDPKLLQWYEDRDEKFDTFWHQKIDEAETKEAAQTWRTVANNLRVSSPNATAVKVLDIFNTELSERPSDIDTTILTTGGVFGVNFKRSATKEEALVYRKSLQRIATDAARNVTSSDKICDTLLKRLYTAPKFLTLTDEQQEKLTKHRQTLFLGAVSLAQKDRTLTDVEWDKLGKKVGLAPGAAKKVVDRVEAIWN